ncbi:MAG TPA: lipopolysaccharide biosynthesis protein RfbH [Anaerolineales bacterium]|nr:lipopolysaccharide biosynthesis protein RfbH [Anaerolineales bacterium]
MKVPISGQVTGKEEADNVMQVANSQSYGGFIWTNRFERGFARFMSAREAILCNSGSSANLLALAALELPKGSEVITTAVNFPTTVNCIIQLGLVPVFVDSDPKTLNNINMANVWEAISDKTRAVIMAHALGNPVDLSGICDWYPTIEDCCDAVGSTINGQMVGRRGIMSTVSFYPAHHITTGEGGAVLTDSPRLRKVIESYRDWGRDCFCEPGKDNTCGKRFNYEVDHKYIYSRIGWNLKANDLAAAVGVAQLDRLEGFIQKRRENWAYLNEGLKDLPIEIVQATPGSNPSWFGFAFLTERRNELARYLDEHGVGSRPVMAGNLLRQPAYRKLINGVDYRVVGNLDGADLIYERGIWIGVFPGITPDMRDYQVEVIRKYFNG